LIPVISFIGHSQCEKTSVIQHIAKELTVLGLRVGVIKESDNEVTRDLLKRDTIAEYFVHGIESVCFHSDQGILTLQTNTEQPLTYILFKLFTDVDIILAEGFNNLKNVPKIEIARAEVCPELSQQTSGVKAIIADFPTSFEPQYSYTQTKELARFITNNFMRRGEEHCIDVFADGKRLPLKSFVKLSLRGTLLGFLESLKFTDNVGLFEIKIKNNRR